ncbi:hypothetical protein DM01DRAFT_1331361 [Hesseltinella vesiculosa]|uniref:Formin GTPase-binding domain-containing protein n=1 Tax=Hesseltinella vesiculosa TaxID=101127 RepID=A0A1X2GV11_9FUNG|nr:hypothetical protein DM01DRAFT_1331361 [Hesseltinella vesiculosa]
MLQSSSNGGGSGFNGQSSSQQQPRLINRMQDFLFQKRHRAFLQGDYDSGMSVDGMSTSSAMVASSIAGTTSIYSAMDEDTASRVDSMFSSIQSNQSNIRPNPNTPPPVRTVHLDAHSHPSAQSPPLYNPLSSPLARSSGSSPPLTDPTSSQTTDDFEEAFQKLAREYGIPEEVASSFTLERKKVLLTSQAQIQQPTSNNGFFSWRTWGKKQKQRFDIRQGNMFEASPTMNNNNSSESPMQPQGMPGNGRKWRMGYSTSARGRMQRASIMTYQHGKGSHRPDRTIKTGFSPEDFISLLQSCHIRELNESQVQELRVCLRSVKASWTTDFLRLGGYVVLSDLFRQMKEAPKREKNDDKILQHLAKCFKAIMMHEQAGTEIVLSNPIGLEHIRDLLFGPVNQKQKQLYSLSVITRAHFLNILCTLSSLQCNRPATESQEEWYVHGYDVLRRLLLDCPATTLDPTITTGSPTQATPSPAQPMAPANAGFAASDDPNQLPFRMTLKTDPKDVMAFILQNDPFATPNQPPVPRYTAWMRELQYTVEKEIEPITFLAQVLDYKFESAFRQLRIKPPSHQDPASQEEPSQPPPDIPEQQASNTVMVDDGVVEYLIAHLRLINTVIATQPIFYKGIYGDLEREMVRTEIMMSGFDKISKALRYCPHPMLYALYYRYLSPLLEPQASLSMAIHHQENAPAAALTSDGAWPTQDQRQGLDPGYGEGDDEEEYLYMEDDGDDQWEDEDDTVDPLAYTDLMDEDLEFLMEGDDDDDDDLFAGQSNAYRGDSFEQQHRWKMYESTAR